MPPKQEGQELPSKEQALFRQLVKQYEVCILIIKVAFSSIRQIKSDIDSSRTPSDTI